MRQRRLCTDEYFQISPPPPPKKKKKKKKYGSQEDKQISISGCPHTFFGCRGHENFAALLQYVQNVDHDQNPK